MIGSKILKFLTSLHLVFRNIGIVCLVIVTALLFLESITRKFMNVSIITVNEVGGIGMYLFIMFNISWLYKVDGHIKSDFFVSLLPIKLRNILDLFLHIMTLVFACLVTYLWWKYLVVTTFVDGRFSGMTGIKEWPSHMLGMIGWGMLVFAAVERFVTGLLQVFGKIRINESGGK